MTKLLNSDLARANSCSDLQMLLEIKSDFENINKTIQDFVNNSQTTLIGDGYDAVRKKMSMYIDAFQKQMTVCEYLENNIKVANNTMLNYMQGYSLLDTADIPQYESSIRQINDMIAYLQSSLSYLKSDSYNSVVYLISTLNSQLIELNKFLELLKGLEAADADAASMITSVEADVDGLSKAISGINETTFNKNKSTSTKNSELASELSSIPMNKRLGYLFPDGYTSMSPHLTYVTVEGYDANGNLTTQELRVHKKLADAVVAIYEEMKDIGYPALASTSWGYANKQTSVGPSGNSAHSYGAAIDVNAVYNRQYLDPAKNTSEYAITQEVVDIWAKYGFTWGGDWTTCYDEMHFTYLGY